MNEYDTELIKGILTKAKYDFVDSEYDADIVMLNTCAIRENAHRKAYGRIHDIKYKRNGKKGQVRKGSGPLIGILGCMATNLRTDLLENKNIDIDFIAGPDSYKRLPNLIAEAAKKGDKPFDLTLSEFETYSDVYPKREKGVNAWIAVMRGCNNFCTFCVVPYTRGRERSRSVENVVDEAKRLADEGFKQVTLLGQNVNSYKHDDSTFANLIDAVSRVDGIERIRFTSPHPKDFPMPLLKVIAENPKACKQIHLPLQAGSTRVLDLMNRTYSREEFMDVVKTTRATIPHVALSTDVIVGFSTETDADFEETYEVMKEVEFDSAFIFKYSERKNTIAQKKLPDDIPEAIKTERIVRLNELQKEISAHKNQAYVGTTQRVLIETEEATKSENCFTGRTDSNKIVVFPSGNYKVGDFIHLEVTGASAHALKGKVAINP